MREALARFSLPFPLLVLSPRLLFPLLTRWHSLADQAERQTPPLEKRRVTPLRGQSGPPRRRLSISPSPDRPPSSPGQKRRFMLKPWPPLPFPRAHPLSPFSPLLTACTFLVSFLFCLLPSTSISLDKRVRESTSPAEYWFIPGRDARSLALCEPAV